MQNKGKTTPADEAVLIGIVKDRRDFDLLLRERWYRIPAEHAPSRRFGYLAFYQPASFGRHGKCIRYVAPVLGRASVRRREILPREPGHPRAGELYWRYRIGKPLLLPEPVRNLGPRRITFAFTTLRRLFESHDILDVFGIPPIERIMRSAMARAGIPAFPEFTVSMGKRLRYRLDFAVFCAGGALAVECDGTQYHSGCAQLVRDRTRDRRLRKAGWTVLRFGEDEITAAPAACARRVVAACRHLGGAVKASGN